MAKDYARPFYDSKEWRKTREAYLQSQHYICERCGGAASVAVISTSALLEIEKGRRFFRPVKADKTTPKYL